MNILSTHKLVYEYKMIIAAIIFFMATETSSASITFFANYPTPIYETDISCDIGAYIFRENRNTEKLYYIYDGVEMVNLYPLSCKDFPSTDKAFTKASKKLFAVEYNICFSGFRQQQELTINKLPSNEISYYVKLPKYDYPGENGTLIISTGPFTAPTIHKCVLLFMDE